MRTAQRQILLFATSLTLATPCLAANSLVFIDAAACVASGAYSQADCRRAEQNARAEFERKAPRFPTRAACERAFPRCMIGDVFASGGVDFIPTLRGFAIPDGRRSGATPVLDGGAIARRAAPGVARTSAKPKDAADANQPIAQGPGVYPMPEAQLRDLQQRERRFGVNKPN